MNHLFQQKHSVNYLYFSILTLFLLALNLLHFLREDALPIFLVYSMQQTLCEVAIFIFMASLLKNRFLHTFFVGATFLVLLLYIANFFLAHLMDTSIGYVFNFFLGSGVSHLITGFQALHINKAMICMMVIAFLAIPGIGIALYTLSFRLTKEKPLFVSCKRLGLTLGALMFALLMTEGIIHPRLTSEQYRRYQKMFPFATTLLPPKQEIVTLKTPLSCMRQEPLLATGSLDVLPNIYFFVIETFRNDFLSCAPHLSQFGKENIQFLHSYSNANSTHLSWFSLFHANLPFHWCDMKDHWKKGSVPLRLLKQLGYKIHVYSSTPLHYFDLDTLIFGSNCELIDSFYEFEGEPPYALDAKAIDQALLDLQPQGHAYFFFLDSPHSEYSFPPTFPLRYTPISTHVDYLQLAPGSHELEMMKNRYRNSIAYVDTLMHRFFQTLKEKNLYEDALISITGDHGEEFFEEGALFHGTHVNRYQTNVPILLKCPPSFLVQTNEATHIDIFPSLLHALYRTPPPDIFDGLSVFDAKRHPFRTILFHKGPDTPIDFVLENEDFYLKGRTVDAAHLEIMHSKGNYQKYLPLELQEEGAKH